ncbi:uncharacterized protein LOC133731107 [Rosa rugosa]|uniref:uncharacterized protein LOC133731107 n=1 Tax=Rosa rugosa TaxID=74645 RepID=UPI002B40386D|nr:uncharacterized protein LOC133731107 [Rosa rugosa]
MARQVDVDLPDNGRITDHRVNMLLPDEVYLSFPDTVLEYLNQRAEEEAGVEGHEARGIRGPAQNPQGNAAPEVQPESGEGVVGVAQVIETGTHGQDGEGDGIRVLDTCARTDGVGSKKRTASQLCLGSPPVGVAIDTRGSKRSRGSRDEVAGGLARTLGEIGITDGAILHMVADLRNCHLDRSRVNAEDPRLGYREAQERLMRAVNMNYHASGELVAHFDREIARLQRELNVERERARELQSVLNQGLVEREDMRRAIDDGIMRRMELERSPAVEEARRQEAEGTIAQLREANLDLTGRLQRAEDGLKVVDQVRARVTEAEEHLRELERQVRDRDAELELRAATLESLAPFPNRVVELEGQVGTLQMEVDRLRDVELEVGKREAEMERLRKELAEQQARASDFAEEFIRLRAAAETHRDKLHKARRDGADKAVDLYLRSDHFQEKLNKAFSDGALHSI